MRIIDVPDSLALRIVAALEDFESIAGELRRLNRKVSRIEGHEEQSVIDLSALTANVAAGRTVDESNKILLEGIARELVDDPPPQRIQALAAKLKESAGELSAAVIANTPSAVS